MMWTQLPPFTEVRRVAAQLRLDAAKGTSTSDADILKLAEDEIRELRDSSEKDRSTYQGLVDQYEASATRHPKGGASQTANGYLRQRIRFLETQVKLLSKNAGAVPIPSSLDQFESWCHDYLSGAVEVHNRAIQGARVSL